MSTPVGADGQPRAGALRAGDVDRERVLTQLAEHYAEGRLTLAEFDERSSRAMDATYHHELDALVTDLPGSSVAISHHARGWRPPPTPAQPSRLGPRTFGPGRFAPALVLLIAMLVLTRGAVIWLVPLLWWVAATGFHNRGGGWCGQGARGRYRGRTPAPSRARLDPR